jgi:hypothetical protein
LKDTLPEGILLVSGINKYEVDLEGQESRDVYLYRIEAPKDYAPPTINITTLLKFQEYTIEKSSVITVLDQANTTNSTLQQLPANTTLPPTNTTNVTTTNTTNTTRHDEEPKTTTTNAKDESVLSKITKGIGRFFQKLFGS